jgi:hypothetical protein
MNPPLLQLRAAIPLMALAWIPIGAILIWTGMQSSIPTSMLFRDPAAIAELPAYAGALSHLGVLLWCAAATVCLFTYLIFPVAVRRTSTGGFILWSGILTALLTVDDLFQVHEVASGILQIPDFLIVGVYGVIALAIFFVHRRELVRTNLVLFSTAMLCLGTSVVVDAFDPKHLFGTRYHLVEDGPKLLGIAVWLGYFATLCLARLREAVQSTADRVAPARAHQPDLVHRR